jgi:hypothetical protein
LAGTAALSSLRGRLTAAAARLGAVPLRAAVGRASLAQSPASRLSALGSVLWLPARTDALRRLFASPALDAVAAAPLVRLTGLTRLTATLRPRLVAPRGLFGPPDPGPTGLFAPTCPARLVATVRRSITTGPVSGLGLV